MAIHELHTHVTNYLTYEILCTSSCSSSPEDQGLGRSLQCYCLDFNGDTFWQLVDRDATPSRLMDKPLLVLGIHLREILHVSEEHLVYLVSVEGTPKDPKA